MKSRIFAAALLSISLVTSSFANNNNPKPVMITREIAVTAPFEKILVGDYLTVVLVQDPAVTSISISGDEKSVQYVTANIEKKSLKILSKKSPEGKIITIYVPVKDLFYVMLSNGSSLTGKGALTFTKLTVTLNDDAHVALNAFGEINIESGNNCDIVYEKDERYKVLNGKF